MGNKKKQQRSKKNPSQKATTKSAGKKPIANVDPEAQDKDAGALSDLEEDSRALFTTLLHEAPKPIQEQIKAWAHKKEQSQPNFQSPLPAQQAVKNPKQLQRLRRLNKHIANSKELVRDYLISYYGEHGGNPDLRFQIFLFEDLMYIGHELDDYPQILLQALSSVGDSFHFWECCCCFTKFCDPHSLIYHVDEAHVPNFKAEGTLCLPPPPSSAVVDILLDARNWKPLDFDPSAQKKVLDEMPVSDDEDRIMLLEKIATLLRILLAKECLSSCHVDTVIEHAMEEEEEDQRCPVDCGRTLLRLRFLGASQLEKILGFLNSVREAYSEILVPVILMSENPVLESDPVENRWWEFIFRAGGNNLVVDLQSLSQMLGCKWGAADVHAIVEWLYTFPPRAHVKYMQEQEWKDGRVFRRTMAVEILKSIELEVKYMCEFYDDAQLRNVTGGVELSLVHVKIMKRLENIRRLNLMLSRASFLDYLPVVLPTVQSYLLVCILVVVGFFLILLLCLLIS